MVHFACLLICSIPYYCSVSTFHCPSQFVLKSWIFSLCSSKDLHANKYKHVNIAKKVFCFFFCLTYVKPKHQNKTSENNFQCLIWMFWVCQLPCAWSNTDYSQLMFLWSLSTSTRLLIMKHRPERNLQHKLWKSLKKKLWTSFFLSLFFLKVYFFILICVLAVMGLCCCTWTSSSCGNGGYTLRWWTTHFGGFSGGWAQHMEFSGCPTRAQ